ncbi:FAD-dependent oxidoreductase [Candidatus Microgenomates bacterium]|nr:FAD-dependent oxidoreductase [Candidatus Microgenomates bacterium]
MLAKIKTKKLVAKGTLLVEFDLLGQTVNFQPGQFFFITLQAMPYTDERGNRRHFTIVNSPTKNDILSFTTRLRESAFKKTIKELPNGSEVEVGPIKGNFILPAKTIFPLVFVAGGIGITPYLSMLRFIKDKKLPYDITLLYSNPDEESAAYLEELKSLEKEIPRFRLVLTMTKQDSWQGEKRRIDGEFVKKYLSDYRHRQFFIAGPPAMVEGTKKELLHLGIGEEKIKTENFTGY